MFTTNLLNAVSVIQQTPFSVFLQDLLKERGGSKSALYDYLVAQDYYIEKTSLYRYFNASKGVNRIPDALFLCWFARYLNLSEQEERALLMLWQMKRRRKKV